MSRDAFNELSHIPGGGLTLTHLLHDVFPERAVTLKLGLVEKLICSRFMRELGKLSFVVTDILRLIEVDGGLDVDQDTIWRVLAIDV